MRLLKYTVLKIIYHRYQPILSANLFSQLLTTNSQNQIPREATFEALIALWTYLLYTDSRLQYHRKIRSRHCWQGTCEAAVQSTRRILFWFFSLWVSFNNMEYFSNSMLLVELKVAELRLRKNMKKHMLNQKQSRLRMIHKSYFLFDIRQRHHASP